MKIVKTLGGAILVGNSLTSPVYANAWQNGEGVWHDGNDLTKEPYQGDNTAVTMLHKSVNDPTLGSYHGLGTGTFIAPNVILTVGHNYLEYQKDHPQYNNKLTPNTTFYYNLGTTNMDARNTWVPRDGVDKSLGTTSNMSVRFKHMDTSKYSHPGTDDEIDWQYDFSLVVTDTPMQFVSPNKKAEPLDLIDQSAMNAAENGGYSLYYAGYMADFKQGSDSSLVKNPNAIPGNLLSVRTKTNRLSTLRRGDNGTIVSWSNTSGGGFSGSALRNAQGKVVGVLNGGVNGKDGNNIGLVFNQKALDWIRRVIKENQIKGWRTHQGQQYYFQENGHLYRNTTEIIDDAVWDFDENGVATRDTMDKGPAMTEIKNAATTKANEIDSADILPAAKIRLKAQVTKAQEDGIASVKSARNRQDVTSRLANAINDINAISTAADIAAKAKADADAAKPAAVSAVNSAADAKIREIDNADILPGAKTRLKARVTKTKDDGVASINSAVTVVDVNKDRDDAVRDINAISLDADIADKIKHDADDAKSKAIPAVNNSANAKIREIDSADIFNDAKVRLKSQVTKAKDDGIGVVNAATKAADVNKGKDDAIRNINAVSTAADIADKIKKDADDAKSKAIPAINKAASDKNNEIDSADIFNDAKVRLKSQVTKAKDDGVGIVNSATKAADVNKGKDDTIRNINAVSTAADIADKIKRDANDAKAKAVPLMNAAAVTKNNEIDDADIFVEARAKLKAQVSKALNDGVSAVNADTKATDVNQHRDETISNIGKISVDADVADKIRKDADDAKSKANPLIDKAVADKLNEIDKADIFDAAKVKLKAQVTKAKEDGLAAINSDTKAVDVNKHRDETIADIGKISVDADVADKLKKDADDARSNAIPLIDKSATDKLNEIDKANIFDEAKAKLKAQVTKAKEDGLTALNGATKAVDVNKHRDDTIANMGKISVEEDVADKIKKDADDAKSKAILLIDKSATDKLNEIDKADIFDAAKAKLKDKMAKAKEDGLVAVNSATKATDVNKHRDDTIANIGKISVEADVADKIKKDADDAKSKAIPLIDKAVANKLNEIDKADIFDTAKKKLKDQIAKAKDVSVIHSATTAADVNKHRDNIIATINKISVEADVADKIKKDLDNAKAKAIQIIDKAAADKNNEIDKADILDAAKTKLKTQVAKIKEDGISSINSATKAVDMNKLRDIVDNIGKVSVNADVTAKIKKDVDDAKSQATAEIHKVAADKLKEIGDADMFDDAKLKLKAQVTKAKEVGVSTIGTLTKITDINKQKDDTINQIRSISITEDVVKKRGTKSSSPNKVTPNVHVDKPTKNDILTHNDTKVDTNKINDGDNKVDTNVSVNTNKPNKDKVDTKTNITKTNTTKVNTNVLVDTNKVNTDKVGNTTKVNTNEVGKVGTNKTGNTVNTNKVDSDNGGINTNVNGVSDKVSNIRTSANVNKPVINTPKLTKQKQLQDAYEKEKSKIFNSNVSKGEQKRQIDQLDARYERDLKHLDTKPKQLPQTGDTSALLGTLMTMLGLPFTKRKKQSQG